MLLLLLACGPIERVEALLLLELDWYLGLLCYKLLPLLLGPTEGVVGGQVVQSALICRLRIVWVAYYHLIGRLE